MRVKGGGRAGAARSYDEFDGQAHVDFRGSVVEQQFDATHAKRFLVGGSVVLRDKWLPSSCR